MSMTIARSTVDRADEVFSPEALNFVTTLHGEFANRRDELLEERHRHRAAIAAGESLRFDPATSSVRESEWHVAVAPPDLADRRVEITGPTDPKMAINAMNSGAKVWLADLEDANAPTWTNMVTGQVCLWDASRHDLRYTSPEGKRYELAGSGDLATIVARPRGWHLDEPHLQVGGRDAVGALVDFGLHFFNNAVALLERGSGPYFYLPKLESHQEARLWNDVFTFAQDRLGIPYGTIRATVLIETIPAAFQMEEILYELRDHASGLNAGRWDYLFSMIKYFGERGPGYLLPDRNQVSMTAPFLRAYTELLVTTCHRRNAYAIGGMAAFVPNRHDPEFNALAFERVRNDKEREARDGFDGSWVAHPGLVEVCATVFDDVLGEKPNQLDRRTERAEVSAAELCDVSSAPGTITKEGLRNNVAVALRYIGAWLGGVGAVSIFGLMEDAATAEISRSQVWQWLRNDVVFSDGEPITVDLVRAIAAEELDNVRAELGDEGGRYALARDLFEKITFNPDYLDFLTVEALPYLGDV